MAPTKFAFKSEPLVAAGYPPWDGTGVPLPVDDSGWPVIPDGSLPVITSPADGAEIGQYAPFTGTAFPGATVTLQHWVHDSEWRDIDTTTASPSGKFIFAGTTPLEPLGSQTFRVTESVTIASDPITVTIVDKASAPAILSPRDGDTVDPLVDIVGVAGPGRADEDVELWVDSSPGAAVATTTVGPLGEFTFAGDTPLDVASETLWVKTADGMESEHITVTVDLPETPLAADAAHVTLPDGSAPPVGDDGIPILSETVAPDEGYDPGEHTVAEVQDYLATHSSQTEYVLDRERAGKARTTLIGA